MLASTAKGFAPYEPFRHAARDHGLEKLAQQIALAETAMAVLGKRRMIGNVAVETQEAEPAIVEVNLLAKPPLGANAEAVADDQHPDHQFRIDRGPSNVAVIGLQMRSQPSQIDEPVDLAKHVIVRDMPLKAEAVKQRPLHRPPFAHHRPNLPWQGEGNQRSFSTQSGESGHSIGRLEVSG
jgi:hypothetical protein